MPNPIPSSPAARTFARSRCHIYLRPGSRIPHRPTSMLFVPPLFAIVNQIPANISSSATTTQTLFVSAPCTMTAKLWGAGGGGFDPFSPSSPRGGGGGFATAVFSLNTGDIVTYAAGGRGLSENPAGSGSSGGSSGSGTRNGGAGMAAGAGATELYINGVARLLAGGGGGAGAGWTVGGGGGGSSGQNGASPDITQTGGGGGTQFGPGAGGLGPSGSGGNGSPGSGGTGGAGGRNDVGIPPGGGGGGGYFGGGGGAHASGAPPSAGGGGSAYDSTGSGTLIAATDWQAANRSDPDWIGNAGNAEVNGLVVLKFAV